MKSFITSVAFAAVVTLISSTAMAQAPSRAGYNLDPRITGYTFGPYTGGTQLYRRHAANHVEVLRHYAEQKTPIPADVAKEHATEIRRNLNKSFADLEKVSVELKDDKAAQALLSSIKAIHKNADEVCTMLETECLKNVVDGAKVADCCSDMVKQLEAATLLHDQLLKHLGTAAKK